MVGLGKIRKFTLVSLFVVLLLVSSFAFSIGQEGSSVDLFSGNTKDLKVSSEGPLLQEIPANLVQDNSVKITESQRKANINRIKDEFVGSEMVSILVWYKDGYTTDQILKGLKGYDLKYDYEGLNGFAVSLDQKNFVSLIKNKGIDYVAFDEPVVGFLTESVSLIGASSVRTTMGYDGSGVGVCQLDSGVDYNNQYLSIAGGYDFVNNDTNPMDDNGHGTSTAGVIKSNHPVLTGVAPNVNFLAVKVLDANATGTSSDIISGILWCVNNRFVYNISVISMSLGTTNTYTPSTSPLTYDFAIDYAVSNGISLVASSGNNGDIIGISYPAVSPNVISVGATYDKNFTSSQTFSAPYYTCSDVNPSLDQITCYSNRPSFVDIVAPGSSILTTRRLTGTTQTNPFVTAAGTSMAAPHVAGVIALMAERNSHLYSDEVKEIITTSPVQVTDSVTGFTFPRLDAVSALNNVPRITASGPIAPGAVITFDVDAPLDPGLFYAIVISEGYDPGVYLPDGTGRWLPLNPSPLFYLTQDGAVNTAGGFYNSQGILDSNGHGQATVYVPNQPGVENIDLYFAYVTINWTEGFFFPSVSNPVKI